jgi:hypothetical protein
MITLQTTRDFKFGVSETGSPQGPKKENFFSRMGEVLRKMKSEMTALRATLPEKLQEKQIAKISARANKSAELASQLNGEAVEASNFEPAAVDAIANQGFVKDSFDIAKVGSEVAIDAARIVAKPARSGLAGLVDSIAENQANSLNKSARVKSDKAIETGINASGDKQEFLDSIDLTQDSPNLAAKYGVKTYGELIQKIHKDGEVSNEERVDLANIEKDMEYRAFNTKAGNKLFN